MASFKSSKTELEHVNSTLTEVESKSIKASKDCSAVESQLQDVQVLCHTCVHTHTNTLIDWLSILVHHLECFWTSVF